MEPTGATKVHNAVVDAVCQKLAILIGGGLVDTLAGVLTDTEVSENSREGEDADPIQSTEQVTLAPCTDTGDQMSTRFSFTEPNTDPTCVFATVPKDPAAHIREVGVRAVAVPEVEINR